VEDLLTLEIDSLAHGGDSVARTAEGVTVFVRGGCPGDTVRARVLADHGRYRNAVVVDVVAPSKDRVAAPCPFFGACGGCQWQHVAYPAQLEAKRRAVADALERIAKLPARVADTLPSPREYGYRNRVELRVARVADRTEVGYSAAGEDRLVPVDRCLLLPPRHEKVPGALGGVLRFLARDPAAATVTRAGFRVAVHGADTAVDLWTPPGPFPRQIAGRTVAQATRAGSVTRVLQRGGHRRDIAGVEVLAGDALWHESLGDWSFGVSPASFFQTNTRLAERMTALVLEALQPAEADRVLDLYAGVGTFTLPLADTGAEVVAVEGTGSAVRDLRRNLELNGVCADVAPGDAARALADLGRFDLAVVDPPRAGMRPDALAALIDASPRRIAYVSCDPATLARDARMLADAGWTLGDVTPVDLFPQTYHVETVAVLERSS
jgi:23S rRNA (uracil1939-C5)-methyltransferase